MDDGLEPQSPLCADVALAQALGDLGAAIFGIGTVRLHYFVYASDQISLIFLQAFL